MGETGGTQGACDEGPPICDTFTLTVADPGTKLVVTALGAGEEDAMAIAIVDPEGNETFAYTGDFGAPVAAAVDDPVAGEYTIHVLASPFPGPTTDYTADATLEGAAAPEPTATPTPTPVPPASPTPAPTATPAPEPAAAAPAPARTLAVEPDLRRVRRAVESGFRMRSSAPAAA